MLLQNLTSAGYFNRLQVFWLGSVHLSGFVLVNNSDLCAQSHSKAVKLGNVTVNDVNPNRVNATGDSSVNLDISLNLSDGAQVSVSSLSQEQCEMYFHMGGSVV